jgi:hypothetical protein
VTEFTGEPENLEFERIVWEKRGQLGFYDFLDGDVALVKTLTLSGAGDSPATSSKR